MASNKGKSHRSAVTGQYVTEKYAKSHPKTTVSERTFKSSKKPKS